MLFINEQWSYDVNCLDVTALSDQEIKSKIFDLDKHYYKAHILDTSNAAVKRLISAKEDGYYLLSFIVSHISNKESAQEFDSTNFIYIEQVDEMMFVASIHDGEVMLDKGITKSDYEWSLILQMLQHAALDNKTSIVVAKNVDIDELMVGYNDNVDKIKSKSLSISPFIYDCAPTSNTKKFTKSIDVKFKKKINLKPLAAIAITALVGGYFLVVENEKSPVAVKKVIEPAYKKLNQALEESAINVKTRLSYLFNDTIAINTLTGWDVKTVRLEPKSAIITFDNDNQGTFKELERFSFQYNYKISKVSHNYVAIGKVKHTPVLDKAVLVPSDGIIRFIEDAGNDWLPNFKVDKVSNPISNSKWQEVVFNIKILDGFSKYDFDVLGTIVNGLPVSFKQATLNYDKKTNTYMGNVELLVYGGVYK